MSAEIEPRELHEEDTDHDHAASDPHVWLDVQHVITWTTTIAETLSVLDPDQAPLYQANAAAYIQNLEALDGWIVEQIDTLPPENRKMVTSHDSFGYFADRYELQIIGVGVEPSRGMRKGMVVDVAEASIAIASAIEKAEQSSGYELSDALVSMAGEHISCTNSRGLAPINQENNGIVVDDI